MAQMQWFSRGNIKGTMSALPQKRMFAVAIGMSASCQKHFGLPTGSARDTLAGAYQDLARFRRIDHSASKAGAAFGRICQLI